MCLATLKTSLSLSNRELSQRGGGCIFLSLLNTVVSVTQLHEIHLCQINCIPQGTDLLQIHLEKLLPVIMARGAQEGKHN